MLRLFAACVALAVFSIWMSGESAAQDIGRYSTPALSPSSSVILNSAGLGLKPDSSQIKSDSDLPLGVNYDSSASSVLVPVDNKNEWGLGINLNVNASRTVEMAPTSALGLQPKRQPGLMLQKKF